jgi:tRNA(fMet)-specific endonuclease VapC
MASIFMLDTDICSYIIRENPKELKDAFIAHQNDLICISIITYAELIYGALNNPSKQLQKKLEQFISLVQIIDWTENSAHQYAKIRQVLTTNGTPIGNIDMMIAAAALASDAELVTNNKKHFRIVPNLKIADWV